MPNTLRPRSFAFSLLLLAALAPLARAQHALPPPQDATKYPAFDAHGDEKVAIAAIPFQTKEEMKYFRVDYLKNNFLPILIVVTNNGDKPISLAQARIDFIGANNDRVQAAEPEDVERRMTHVSNTGRAVPMPAPLPPMGGKPKTPDAKIEADFRQLEYQDVTVPPHSTKYGFLFYDMEGLGGNPLRDAKLTFRRVQDSDGRDFFPYDIPFNKFLDVQKGATQ
ncbi:hypothetical protein [Silvibacterium sp.]|uniref:hypothetical protein n=1 Tax=Silvibacterium sp. TaxID=1964179 RepID=UPI0039E4EA3F